MGRVARRGAAGLPRGDARDRGMSPRVRPAAAGGGELVADVRTPTAPRVAAPEHALRDPSAIVVPVAERR